MTQEIKRVLHSEGLLIISSPDKCVYSDIPGYLYAREFEALLREHFANVEMFGQRRRRLPSAYFPLEF